MAHKQLPCGFTLLEALIALVVVALLAAVLFPAMVAAKQRATIGTAVQRLRQIHVGLELYRNEWDGTDVFTSFRSYNLLGLPLPWRSPGYAELPGVPPSVWQSPCAPSEGVGDWTICTTTLFPGYCLQGYVSYVAGLYHPDLVDGPMAASGNRHDFLYYLETYKANSVIAVEVHCNPAGTNMRARFTRKRGIALLLSGQIVNRVAEGNASRLRWYSEPME